MKKWIFIVLAILGGLFLLRLFIASRNSGPILGGMLTDLPKTNFVPDDDPASWLWNPIP